MRKEKILGKMLALCVASTMVTGVFVGADFKSTQADTADTPESATQEVVEDYIWDSYFGSNMGWYEGARGTLTEMSDTAWTAQLDIIGWGGVYGAHVYAPFEISANNTYKLSFEMLSTDIDKWVFVKVADDKENMVFGKWIRLIAGEEQSVTMEFTPLSDASIIRFCLGGEFGDRSDEADMYAMLDVVPDDADANYSTTIECRNFSLTETKEESTTIGCIMPPYPTTEAVTTTTVSNESSSVAANNLEKPAKVKIKSVKRKAKSATVKIGKVKNAKGYQIKYGTSKKLKKNITTKLIKSTSFTIKKLKASKKYYVKVRAYVLDGNDKIFGKWSKVKTIKKYK